MKYSKTLFSISTRSQIFPAFEIKKLAFVGKILWRFEIVYIYG